MEYHSESDYYICQKGRKLIITSGKKSKSKTGYETIKTQHTCESCDGYSYKARTYEILGDFKAFQEKRQDGLEWLLSNGGN